jgi:hypothetical protein
VQHEGVALARRERCHAVSFRGSLMLEEDGQVFLPDVP